MQLSEKPKTFSQFFIAFLESTILNILKTMSLIAQVFLKLLTPKMRLLKRIKGLVSENPLAKNVLKNI